MLSTYYDGFLMMLVMVSVIGVAYLVVKWAVDKCSRD